ncbi:MAG: VOC family protein [Steroidobacteraceae bacterium]|nr:VOC family protein [Steroidobacteraceae bacterium]MDW8259968.1 hypothetical protein [Gammaproteobacteria bacterium]
MPASAPAAAPVVSAPQPRAFAYVVLSVADMERALGLWVERFGMQVLARREGRDADLARVWGLAADDIVDQALLRTPGVPVGGVHLVRFRVPGPTVRADAAPTDWVIKSVDIAVRDIDARYAELSAAGYRFRAPVGRLRTATLEFLETHMFGPDDVNLVLIEIPSQPLPASDRGYGIAPQIVIVTPDNTREAAFLQEVVGLAPLSRNTFSGPEIEKSVGLPPGASLDVRILGDPEQAFGRIELVQYSGAPSRNLHPRARPPARGLLSVTYVVPQLDHILSRGQPFGIADHGPVSTVLGEGRLASVVSPAGVRLDFFVAGSAR